MKKDKITVICLAAGQGKRMNSKIQKQYLLIQDKPVLYYSLKAFQDSEADEIILVVGSKEAEEVKREIVDKYELTKVSAIVDGGKERYHSVYCGLKAIESSDYVLIHDGARPFVTGEIIKRCIDTVKSEKACVAGMPVKDTIKLADENGKIAATPQRELVWQIQTPQCFEYKLILNAYEKLIKREENGEKILVTDDAMVVETEENRKVSLVEGSYKNIKITTPEDIVIAEAFLRNLKI